MDCDTSSSSSSSSYNSEEIDSAPQSIKTYEMDCDDCEKLDDDLDDVGPIVKRWMKDLTVQNVKRDLKCIICERCVFFCASSETLICHLKLAHNINIEHRIINFPSMPDFDMWKVDEEIRTDTKYVFKRIDRDSEGKVYDFRCQMSIPLHSKNNRRKQGNPGVEYAERVGVCPSNIQVTEMPDGTIKAIHYVDHLGHFLEDESVRNVIMNPDQIPESLGQNWSSDLQQKKVDEPRKKKGYRNTRFDYLLREDINVLTNKATRFQRNPEQDGRMIHIWIKRLDLEGANQTPVVYYNSLNRIREYTLIIIHEVQKEAFMHAYDDSIVYVKTKRGEAKVDFNMTAVTIVTAEGNAIPIAFCLSRKVEYLTLHTIYHMIHQFYGFIKCKFFVSDNLSQSYVAWKNVMGPSENPMICIFDLEATWEQKIIQYNVPEDKQKRAAAQLNGLLYEFKERFAHQLNQTLSEWSEDERMKSFADFFKRNYANKCEEWAGCFRTHTDPCRTIDAHLAPVNRALEAIYMESYNGIISFLNFVMAYIRDSCLLKLIEWNEKYRIEKMRTTKRNHAEGTQSMRLKAVVTSGSAWIHSEDGYDYVVKKTMNNCNQDCGIFCADCRTCVHQYICPCKDYVVGFNLCKHIHAARVAMARAEEVEELAREAEILERMKRLKMEESSTENDKKNGDDKEEKKANDGEVENRMEISEGPSTSTPPFDTRTQADFLIIQLQEPALSNDEYVAIRNWFRQC